MFPLSLALFVAGGSLAEIGRNNSTLELNIQVIEAFEHGPVIFDVTLTNRGTKPVVVNKEPRFSDSWIDVPDSWKLDPIGLRCAGTRPSYERTLQPGKTWTERHQLHQDFASAFPPGTHNVTAGWVLRSHRRNPNDESRLIAVPTKTVSITISPATPANRYALAARLEAEFRALPEKSWRETSSEEDSPVWMLAGKVTRTPHKELIPLALCIFDRASLKPPLTPAWHFLQDHLVDMVFRADPATAHRVFVDRLLGSPQFDPEIVFRQWERPGEGLAWIGRTVFWRPIEIASWLDGFSWQNILAFDALFDIIPWANQLAPQIIPEAEFWRLLGARDFRVRVALYLTFSERLGPDLCAAFLKQAQRWAETAHDPKNPDELNPAAKALLDSLWVDRKADRKLLEAFAAGVAENPIAKAARAKLAEELPER